MSASLSCLGAKRPEHSGFPPRSRGFHAVLCSGSASTWNRFQTEGRQNRPMAATLSDVARRAGVSEATASRVLNRRRHVAASTRLVVEEAARDLDYVPNRAARDLSTARTATVALLVHHAQYPAHGEGTFSSRVVDGVSRALRRAGDDTSHGRNSPIRR